MTAYVLNTVTNITYHLHNKYLPTFAFSEYNTFNIIMLKPFNSTCITGKSTIGWYIACITY